MQDLEIVNSFLKVVSKWLLSAYLRGTTVMILNSLGLDFYLMKYLVS